MQYKQKVLTLDEISNLDRTIYIPEFDIVKANSHQDLFLGNEELSPLYINHLINLMNKQTKGKKFLLSQVSIPLYANNPVKTRPHIFKLPEEIKQYKINQQETKLLHLKKCQNQHKLEKHLDKKTKKKIKKPFTVITQRPIAQYELDFLEKLGEAQQYLAIVQMNFNGSKPQELLIKTQGKNLIGNSKTFNLEQLLQ